jgi:hypothetical protein
MSERAGIVELLGRIEKVLAEPADNLVARARHDAVRRIEAAFKAGGYPAAERDQLALSIVPFAFQEANYDGIDWAARDSATLYQLEELLEIDFLTQMAGKRRADVSDAELDEYRQRSLRAIDFRRG